MMHDEDSMSENGGQLATMPNGCFSNNLFLGQPQNDSSSMLADVANASGHTSGNTGDMNGMSASSSSNEYGGYQMSYLNGSKLTSNFR